MVVKQILLKSKEQLEATQIYLHPVDKKNVKPKTKLEQILSIFRDKPKKKTKQILLKSKEKLETKQILLKFKRLGSSGNFGEKCLLFTLANLKKKRRINPISSLSSALETLKPGLKLISQVKSGKVIYLPAYVRPESSYYLATRWIYNAANERNKKVSLPINLSLEICETLDNHGLCLKAKVDLIKSVREARPNIRKSFVKNKKHRHRRGLRRLRLLKRCNGQFIRMRSIINDIRKKRRAKEKEIEARIKKIKLNIFKIKQSDIAEVRRIKLSRIKRLRRLRLTSMISKLVMFNETPTSTFLPNNEHKTMTVTPIEVLNYLTRKLRAIKSTKYKNIKHKKNKFNKVNNAEKEKNAPKVFKNIQNKIKT